MSRQSPVILHGLFWSNVYEILSPKPRILGICNESPVTLKAGSKQRIWRRQTMTEKVMTVVLKFYYDIINVS